MSEAPIHLVASRPERLDPLALEQLRQCMAHLFANAKLALRKTA